MIRLVVYVVYTGICFGAVSAYLFNHVRPWPNQNYVISFLILMGASQIVPLLDLLSPKKRIPVISAIYFGLLVGFLLHLVLLKALEPILEGHSLRDGIVMLTLIVLPYLCISLLLQTKDDFRFVIPYVEFARELKGGRPLILDSSALIDGRISDMVETMVVDVRMIVPQFVLKEIQDIADSSDKNRRSRGRRGLDVLAKLQGNPGADVTLYDSDSLDSTDLSVDQRLVMVAKQLGGRIVTNDFNLNKVAGVQGVDVINLNDVANALKPRFLPGEQLNVRVIKEGESLGQGVGYLDDGTMVVCEQAAHKIGQEVQLVVTSVLQSSAGRMIFGKPTQPANAS